MIHVIQAGLFSAVLTAFLVESYQKLSPDTASQTLQVSSEMLAVSSQSLSMLQQISAQLGSSNTPSSVMGNITQIFPTPSAAASAGFQPSTADIRVNVLWFASLIFSLITASFGILVKQWLREYIAVTNPSPHARLRIRHFRYPELQRWKVLEIAAMLPLLQQLALALFFIGLCYFTASVHESVGHTSLPLVAGWAFCFAIVTLLPLFFPRCPYKTALLKDLLVSVHMWIVDIFSMLAVGFYVRSQELPKLRSALQSLCDTLSIYGEANTESYCISREDADLSILAEVDATQLNDELLGTVIFDSLQQIHGLTSEEVIMFIERALACRLQQEDLVAEQRSLLWLWGLSQTGYTAVIDILSYHLTSRNNLALTQESSLTMAFRILFSPTRYPLPKSGIRVLGEIVPKIGARIVRQLAICSTNPNRTVQEHQICKLLDDVQNRLEQVDVDFVHAIDMIEAILNVHFTDSRCGISRGGLRNWRWVEISPIYRRLILSYLTELMCNALRHPATISSAMDGIRYRPFVGTKKARLVDTLISVFNLSDCMPDENLPTIARYHGRLLNACLGQKGSTSALLEALSQLQPPIFLRLILSWKAINIWDSVGTSSRSNFRNNADWPGGYIAPELGSFMDVVDDYGLFPANRNDSESELTPRDSASPIAALRITCAAICLFITHYATQSSSKIIFDALTNLLLTSVTVSAISKDQATTPQASAVVIDPMLQLSTPSHPRLGTSSFAVPEEAEFAGHILENIQKIDVSTGAQGQVTYDEWLSSFESENSPISDTFVGILVGVYIVSCDPDLDVDDSNWWRVKKLGLVEKIRTALCGPSDANDVYGNSIGIRHPSFKPLLSNSEGIRGLASSCTSAHSGVAIELRRLTLEAATRRLEMARSRGQRRPMTDARQCPRPAVD